MKGPDLPNGAAPMRPEYPLVEVWWDDASAQEEAHDIEDLKDELYMCSVGYLVRESERAVWVCAEIFEDGRMRGTTRIPRGMIKDIRPLRRAAKPRPRIGDTP